MFFETDGKLEKQWKKVSELCLLWNSVVESSYAFIIVDSKNPDCPWEDVSFRSHCFSGEKCFIPWFSYEYKLFLEDLYSTHFSQEFCITWMLLLYFPILNCCLFKQINIYVHVVSLTSCSKLKYFHGVVCGNLLEIVTEIVCNCLTLCMHF